MEVNKVANEVADMEMDMVADIEVDKVLGTTKSFSQLDDCQALDGAKDFTGKIFYRFANNLID